MLDYLVHKDGMVCEYNHLGKRYQMNTSKDGWSFDNFRRENNKKEQIFATILHTNEIIEKIKEQLDNRYLPYILHPFVGTRLLVPRYG